ncbi:hypothetical protein, partial [Bacillus altitudinis]|uniref:hypothetical protein n=1 Tax=Bacillus altitudinis TaxID=293387 RepID=UPI001C92DEBC
NPSTTTRILPFPTFTISLIFLYLPTFKISSSPPSSIQISPSLPTKIISSFIIPSSNPSTHFSPPTSKSNTILA